MRGALTTALAVVLVAVLVAPAVYAAPSAAPDTNACIAAFDQGQRSRTEHHLKQSQTELLACTKESCPALLRADCAEVLRSVQGALPSIVLAADDEGHDITNVKVSSGSDVIAASLDGKAIEFDPGTYDFKFEHAGSPPIAVHFVLREGEKNRVVRASWTPKKPPAGTVAEAPPRTTVGYAVPIAFGAVGVAGFAFAAISRLTFNGDVDDLRATCAPECTQAQRSDLSSTLVRANVAFGIGIGGLVLAAASWIVFTPTPRTTAQAARPRALLTW